MMITSCIVYCQIPEKESNMGNRVFSDVTSACQEYSTFHSIAQNIYNAFQDVSAFSLSDAYDIEPDRQKTSIRARIYENLGIKFERVASGIYKTIHSDAVCVVIEGNGRDLSMIEDSSIDCIVTDHPWLDEISHSGRNRSFAEYDCFRYTEEDFKEKFRVLRDGCFLVEMLPEENENNYKYLYQIKEMAAAVGFSYYAKVPWKKGLIVSNTGRKSKNTKDVMFFSKGKARCMRINKQRRDASGEYCYMSGTAGMLPTIFDVSPISKNKQIHQSEVPVQLYEEILQYITYEGETVLDQFAGSGALGEASLKTGRNSILYEIARESIEKIKYRLKAAGYKTCFS